MKKYIDLLIQKRYSDNTIKTYCNYFKAYCVYFKEKYTQLCLAHQFDGINTIGFTQSLCAN
jgi:hypothetical protein